MQKWLTKEARREPLPWRRAVLGAIAAAALLAPVHAQAAPAGCAALQAKYPDLKGKTLVNAINPHTPGYEAIDPKDPNKYIGFDIDLGEQIGDCLGFKLTYKAVTFAALLTTLASGQADIVISDIYATEERANLCRRDRARLRCAHRNRPRRSAAVRMAPLGQLAGDVRARPSQARHDPV